MSEFTITKTLWREKEKPAMDCNQFYTWINHTLLMLLVQIFWKMSQISDYFKDKPVENTTPELTFSPLSRELKTQRHIRSMSDVQKSTPYRIHHHRSRRGSNHTLMYDSDNRTWKISSFSRPRQIESSDSSDDVQTKPSSIEKRIVKHTDSMRIL